MRILVALVLLTSICICGLMGCSKQADVADGYSLFVYDADLNKFVNVGCRLTFNTDKTEYCMDYMSVVQLYGAVDDMPTGKVLRVNSEAVAQAENALTALIGDQEQSTSEISQSTLTEAIEQSDQDEQIFFYEDKVFCIWTIDLIKRVGNGSKSGYTTIEGEYESAENENDIFLFKDGKVYKNVKDKDGNATFEGDAVVMNEKPGATYILRDGFIILTRINADGGVVFKTNGKPDRTVYLSASLSFPSDLADYVDQAAEQEGVTKEQAQRLAGKTVGLLTQSFYSAKDVSELSFD
jgi:hypothetical protein